MANLRETWTVSENGVQKTMGYAPTYFPGTASLTDARRVTVAIGQDAANTNFSLMPGRAANISGTVVDSLGRPLASRPVALFQEMTGPQGGVMMIGGNAMTAADGSFVIKNVNPGQYRLRAHTLLISNAGLDEDRLALRADEQRVEAERHLVAVVERDIEALPHDARDDAEYGAGVLVVGAVAE